MRVLAARSVGVVCLGHRLPGEVDGARDVARADEGRVGGPLVQSFRPRVDDDDGLLLFPSFAQRRIVARLLPYLREQLHELLERDREPVDGLGLELGLLEPREGLGDLVSVRRGVERGEAAVEDADARDAALLEGIGRERRAEDVGSIAVDEDRAVALDAGVGELVGEEVGGPELEGQPALVRAAEGLFREVDGARDVADDIVQGGDAADVEDAVPVLDGGGVVLGVKFEVLDLDEGDVAGLFGRCCCWL